MPATPAWRGKQPGKTRLAEYRRWWTCMAMPVEERPLQGEGARAVPLVDRDHEAMSPVWLEKPDRIAALAMLTVAGLLVCTVLQQQVRLSLRTHDQRVPGNKGLTATPTAAVVCALCTPIMLVPCAMDKTISLQVHGVQNSHPVGIAVSRTPVRTWR